MIRPTVARVDLGALKSNFRSIVDYLAHERPEHAPRPIAVVKANAYGHGAGEVGWGEEQTGHGASQLRLRR
jgi:alanine racemase